MEGGSNLFVQLSQVFHLCDLRELIFASSLLGSVFKKCENGSRKSSQNVKSGKVKEVSFSRCRGAPGFKT